MKQFEIIVIIVIVFIILFYIYKKNNIKFENFGQYNTTYRRVCSEVRGEVRGETICQEQQYNTITFPAGFTFDSNLNITNNIENFFNIYLSLIDTDYINDKVKQYIDPTSNMQQIFTQKNGSLLDFSDTTVSLLNKIYFGMKNLTDNQLNLYGMYIIIRQKLLNRLNNNDNYIYKYRDFKIIAIPKTMTNQTTINQQLQPNLQSVTVEEYDDNGTRKVITKQKDRKEIENINDCSGNGICIIPIKVLAKQDMTTKYKTTNGLDVYNIRDEINNNISNVIRLCQLNIVRDLFLIYKDAVVPRLNYDTNLTNLQNTNVNFIRLESEISSTLASISPKKNNNVRITEIMTNKDDARESSKVKETLKQRVEKDKEEKNKGK
jgi:hypothetical protein